MQRFDWTESDLKEAIVSGRLIPSIFESGALWPTPVGRNGLRTRMTPAIFVKDWMYLVGVTPTGPFDCTFEYLAKTASDLAGGGEVYSRDGTGYINNRMSLADVVARGAFSIEVLERFEVSRAHAPRLPASPPRLGKAAWWNTSYDVWAMAERIEREAPDKGWGLNERGLRAGRYPLNRLSGVVAAEITASEANKGSKEKIGFKQIEKHLRNAGWNKGNGIT